MAVVLRGRNHKSEVLVDDVSTNSLKLESDCLDTVLVRQASFVM